MDKYTHKPPHGIMPGLLCLGESKTDGSSQSTLQPPAFPPIYEGVAVWGMARRRMNVAGTRKRVAV